MPGIVLKDASANYRETALGWAGCPVDATGLEMAFFFGGTLARSLKNYAPGKANAVATGAPTVNANSLIVSGSAYLTTAMADSASITLVAAYRSLAEVGTIVIGNYAGASPSELRGTNLLAASDTIANGLNNLQGQHSTPATSGVSSPGSFAVNTPVLHAVRFENATSTLTVNNATANTVSSSVIAGTHVAGGPMMMGRGYVNDLPGQTEIYAALGFSRKLTDAELALLCQYLKVYAARRSITI